MKTIIIYLFIGLFINCGCFSIRDEKTNKNSQNPLLLKIKLPEEINLIFLQSMALRASRDPTKKTDKFKKELTKGFYNQLNFKHYLSVNRPIFYTITNTSSSPVYFLLRRIKTSIRLTNEDLNENIICKYIPKTQKAFFGRRGNFVPIAMLTSLKSKESMIGYINPVDCSGFPSPDNNSQMKEKPWNLTLEMEFFSFPYYDVDLFSGKLKSNVKKVIIYPLSEEI